MSADMEKRLTVVEHTDDAVPIKTTDETEERLRWALKLAAQGFKILELQPGSKKPVGGVMWGQAATTDPAKIRAMFKASPSMNYGACPGKDHVIIDLDNKFNAMGAETFGKLEIENEILPETFKVRTRNAGFHIYLKVSEEVGNANRFGKGSGIDVRGACGYVVGPAVRSLGSHGGMASIRPWRVTWTISRSARRGSSPTSASPPTGTHAQVIHFASWTSPTTLRKRSGSWLAASPPLRATTGTSTLLRRSHSSGISDCPRIWRWRRSWRPNGTTGAHRHGRQMSFGP